MPTLTIKPGRHDTRFRMKGLSIKKLGGAGTDLCIDENGYYISNDFNIDGRTALIKKESLIKFLKGFHEELPFDKIKIDGYYELTAGELYSKIIDL